MNIDIINIDGENIFTATMSGLKQKITDNPECKLLISHKYQEIYEYLKSIYRLGKPKLTDEQKDFLMKDKMKGWLLEWWREEGIMKRR